MLRRRRRPRPRCRPPRRAAAARRAPCRPPLCRARLRGKRFRTRPSPGSCRARPVGREAKSAAKEEPQMGGGLSCASPAAPRLGAVRDQGFPPRLRGHSLGAAPQLAAPERAAGAQGEEQRAQRATDCAAQHSRRGRPTPGGRCGRGAARRRRAGPVRTGAREQGGERRRGGATWAGDAGAAVGKLVGHEARRAGAPRGAAAASARQGVAGKTGARGGGCAGSRACCTAKT